MILQDQAGPVIKDLVSKRIDKKKEEELTTEEKLDKKLRINGTWNLYAWRNERTGLSNGEKDIFRQNLEEDPSHHYHVCI